MRKGQECNFLHWVTELKWACEPLLYWLYDEQQETALCFLQLRVSLLCVQLLQGGGVKETQNQFYEMDFNEKTLKLLTYTTAKMITAHLFTCKVRKASPQPCQQLEAAPHTSYSCSGPFFPNKKGTNSGGKESTPLQRWNKKQQRDRSCWQRETVQTHPSSVRWCHPMDEVVRPRPGRCVPVGMRAASSPETEALSSVDSMWLRVSSSRKRLDQVADARVQRNHSPGRHKTLVMVPSVKRRNDCGWNKMLCVNQKY